MSILGWIIIGGFAGWLASMIMKTNASQGIIGNIVVGIIGALIGGFLFSLIGGVGLGGFSLYSLLVAIIGSVVLLWIVKMIKA